MSVRNTKKNINFVALMWPLTRKSHFGKFHIFDQTLQLLICEFHFHVSSVQFLCLPSQTYLVIIKHVTYILTGFFDLCESRCNLCVVCL